MFYHVFQSVSQSKWSMVYLEVRQTALHSRSATCWLRDLQARDWNGVQGKMKIQGPCSNYSEFQNSNCRALKQAQGPPEHEPVWLHGLQPMKPVLHQILLHFSQTACLGVYTLPQTMVRTETANTCASAVCTGSSFLGGSNQLKLILYQGSSQARHRGDLPSMFVEQ